MPQGYAVRGSIILDHLGMAHRNVRGSLFEIAHRVSARLHQPLDKLVRLRNRASRVVHETGLDRSPLICKGLLFFRSQPAQGELLDPPLAGHQHILRLRRSNFAYGSVVLRAELLTQLRSAALAHSHNSHQNRHDHDHCCNDNLDPGVHRFLLLRRMRAPIRAVATNPVN